MELTFLGAFGFALGQGLQRPPFPLILLTSTLSAGLESTVPPAVGEIQNQSDYQPHSEPRPIGPAQAIDHGTADQDAED